MIREQRSLPVPRVELLAARVRWLDRNRRFAALYAAALIAPLLMVWVAGTFSVEWPEMNVTLLALAVSVIVWWVVEVGLVGVTALWETEHDRLLRTRGLPRAILHKIRS
jgi:hypothetical protein